MYPNYYSHSPMLQNYLNVSKRDHFSKNKILNNQLIFTKQPRDFHVYFDDCTLL